MSPPDSSAQAATDGNQAALDILHHAIEALGWGIAQAITLLAPRWSWSAAAFRKSAKCFTWARCGAQVERFVFPPLLGSYQILPAALGEEVVVHGALALAANAT